MSTRLRRVEQLLQREIASVLVQGELRDPRLRPTSAISVTGVDVSPDLSHARVFVDVHGDTPPIERVLEGLNAGASAMRSRLRDRIRLKRLPSLRFVRDESIAHGAAIERVLAEIAAESPPAPELEDDDVDPSDESTSQ